MAWRHERREDSFGPRFETASLAERRQSLCDSCVACRPGDDGLGSHGSYEKHFGPSDGSIDHKAAKDRISNAAAAGARLTQREQPSHITTALETGSEVDACIEKFCLNDDQAETVRCISHWQSETLQENQEAEVAPSSPICLIHGPFGTGKSSLLVAIIHLLTASRADVTAAMHPLIQLAYCSFCSASRCVC